MSEVDYLSLDDLMTLAVIALGAPQVRDYGLLASAAARPQASAFGADAYGTVPEKAAALLHSLVRNHALVDGNKRLGWVAVRTFLELNGLALSMVEDEAYDFVISVAEGNMEVPEIALRIEAASHPVSTG